MLKSGMILVTILVGMVATPASPAFDGGDLDGSISSYVATDAYIENRKSVQSLPRDLIRKISQAIDEKARGENASISESSEFNDIGEAVFARRVYLDIAGRIPTLEELTQFLDSNQADKRYELIDQLLDSVAHQSRQFNYYADLLRLQSRSRIGPNQPYIDYVKDSIRANKPYDKFVSEMLTASGQFMKRGNGAAGYLLRDYGMPEVTMSNTIRIFLGSRLECAQCHDHPTDKWTQRQYFEMVAFFGGVNYTVKDGLGDKEGLAGKCDEGHDETPGRLPPEQRRFLRQA